jgi:hypothetical protein
MVSISRIEVLDFEASEFFKNKFCGKAIRQHDLLAADGYFFCLHFLLGLVFKNRPASR